MKKQELIRVSTKGMAREAWLEARRGSLGGSDAAAVLGLNPYASPYSVWAEKTGRVPDRPDNEAMRLGRDLEDYVAVRWQEMTGKKARRVHAMLYNPAIPFAHANIDRRVVGENAGLECKTTSVLNLKQFKGGEYPDSYYAQCLHYMAVTGAARWYLAVLVMNKGLFCFTVERDEAEISALLRQEEAFWRLVESDTPPKLDGAPATEEALRGMYSGGGAAIELTGQEALFERYAALTAKKGDTEAELAQLKQVLMEKMGNAEGATCGDWSVSWKTQTRRSLDVEALQRVFPELAPFYRSTESRVLRIAKKSKREAKPQ
ncbi:MAG: YqaJ viral recombinase family protein [Firmicutes bacterium]|nr:YqaJ viral recombinase family protein [Bacillota bacterium]